MKKIFTLAALAAICFASCSKNEVIVPETEGNQINFSNYVANAAITKADNVNLAYIENAEKGGLQVVGYHLGGSEWDTYKASAPAEPNFMTMDKVYKTEEGAWTYNNTKYWPTGDDEFTFIAVAPVAALPKWGNTVDFTVNADKSKQTDLIYSCVANVTKAGNAIVEGETTTQATPGTVRFNLGHILSKITLKAKQNATYTGATIIITGITIGETGEGKVAFSQNGDFDVINGKVTAKANATKIPFSFTGTTDLQNATLTTEYKSLSTDASDLIVIPEKLEKILVTVNYDTKIGNTTMHNTKMGNITLDLKPDTVYEIGLNVSLDAIVFDVHAVKGWTNTSAVTNNEIAL